MSEENVILRSLEDELTHSYVSYSMSVIIGRSIPDARDGLKPVQRRILYGMNELDLAHNKPFKKSARIVGEVMGKYHPHGDSSIYEALVRLAQPWLMRYCLVDGQGNFGSIDNDPPAAMRYTEARLTKLAEEMLEDIDKETVPMNDNFDGSLKEPEVLPSKVPNLLLNGANGIAVAMATNIPTHNLKDTVDAIVAYIKNQDISVEELADIIKGPDFPTGGIIIGRAGIKEMYTTGKGAFILRGRVEVENVKKKNRIVITEIPYNVSKSELIEQIAKYLEEEEIPVKDLRDESDREGLRIVIELTEEINADIVIKNLYNKTNLQVRFNANFIVIGSNKQPKLMNLKDIIQEFVNHRFQVIRKRTEYIYKQDSRRAHIVEGLIRASKNIDTIVEIVRSSKDSQAAKLQLIDILGVSEEQATAILDMKLSRLTNLELENLRNEYTELIKKLEKEKEILSSDLKVYEIIIEELNELVQKYGDERRTEITDMDTSDVKYDKKDLIHDKNIVVTLTRKGYIKIMEANVFRTQKRNGKGVTGANLMDDDVINQVLYTRLKNKTLFFTSYGKVYELENYEIEEGSRTSKGKPIIKYLNLEKDEKVLAMVDVKDYFGELLFATRKGIVKRTELSEFKNINARGMRAITFRENDELVSVLRLENDNGTVLLSSKKGMCIRFQIKEVRVTGRSAIGVIGMDLDEDDEIVSATILENDEGQILTITENGFGKRTPVKEYRVQSRGGKGIMNVSDVDKAGYIVGVAQVVGDEKIFVFTKQGATIKVRCEDISVIGRRTKGVRIINLAEGDIVADFVLSNGDEE